MAAATGPPTGRHRRLRKRAAAPLPRRDGVAPGSLVLPPGEWKLVLDFLEERFTNVPRHEIAARMSRGDVVDADGDPIAAEALYTPHRRVFYYRAIEAEEPIPFHENILFRDDHLVVIDKPHFLPVTPSGTYLQETALLRLIRRLRIDELSPLHRIDRETAGLVLFGVIPEERARYHALFTQRSVIKRYLAVAPFRPELQLPLVRRSRLVRGEPFVRTRETSPTERGEPNAETRVELLQILPEGKALYRLTPSTGRKHQLRAHMAALGIPILNDTLYPSLLDHRELRARGFGHPLQLLAQSLSFTDPVTGESRHFESRLRLHHDLSPGRDLDTPGNTAPAPPASR